MPALPLAPLVQPGPGSSGGNGSSSRQGHAAGGALSAGSSAASLLAAVPLLVRREPLAAAGVPAAGPEGGGLTALHPAQHAAAAPSHCFLELHVLGPGKAAQAGLHQPGLLPGSAALHRFLLQVRSSGSWLAVEWLPALCFELVRELLPEDVPACLELGS